MPKFKRNNYFDYKWTRLDENVNPINGSKPVLIVKPVPVGTSKHNFYSGKNENKNYVNYVSSKQEIIDYPNDEFIETIGTRNLKSNFNYVEYMRLENKKHEVETIDDRKMVWKYSNTYIYDGKQANTNKTSRKCKLELVDKNDIANDIHKRSHIWDIVISEKSKELKDLVFKNQHIIGDRIIRAMFDFPVNAIISFHNDTDHPHIHMMVYQNSNTPNEKLRRFYKLKNQKIELAKKSYLTLLHNNKSYIQEIYDLNHKFRNLYDNDVIKKLLIKDLFEINKIVKGCFQFNRLNTKQQNLVKEVAMKILNLETSNSSLINLQNSYFSFIEQSEEFYKKFISYKSNKDKDAAIEQLEKIIKSSEVDFYNRILKSAKDAFEIGIHNYDLEQVKDKIKEIEKILGKHEFNEKYSESYWKTNLKVFKELKNELEKSSKKRIYTKNTTTPSENKKALATIKKLASQSKKDINQKENDFFEKLKDNFKGVQEMKFQLNELMKEIEKKHKIYAHNI